MKETTEQTAQRIVEQDVRYCVSSLISELATNDKYLDELADILQVTDFESACYDAGYRVVKVPAGIYLWLAPGESLEDDSEGFCLTEQEAWSACASDNEIGPNYNEVYEHWAVSEWFAEKLRDRGEAVIDFFGVTIWGRTTTGQAIYMDSVIQKIAEDIQRN